MKIKRTLPSIIDIIKENEKKEQNIKRIRAKRRDTLKVNPNNPNHIEVVQNHQQVKDQQIIGEYLKNKPKIFSKRSNISLSKQQEKNQVDSNGSFSNFKLTAANVAQPSIKTISIKSKFSRKSIFKKNSLESCYGQGIFTEQKLQNVEKKEEQEEPQPQQKNGKDEKLQNKVAYLEKLVDSLSNKLTSKNEESTKVNRWVQKINYLEKSDRKKSAELRRLNLQIQQYERCQKIAKQNEILYGKLASSIKGDSRKKYSQNVGSRFPSFRETPRNEEDEDYNEICSPFMVDKCLGQLNSERNSYYM